MTHLYPLIPPGVSGKGFIFRVLKPKGHGKGEDKASLYLQEMSVRQKTEGVLDDCEASHLWEMPQGEMEDPMSMQNL